MATEPRNDASSASRSARRGFSVPERASAAGKKGHVLGVSHQWTSAEGKAARATRGRAHMNAAQVENIFSYHAPTPEQIPKYETLRAAAKIFALAVLANTPASADQTAAIRKIREAVMTANAAIALDGQS